MMMMMMR